VDSFPLDSYGHCIGYGWFFTTVKPEYLQNIAFFLKYHVDLWRYWWLKIAVLTLPGNCRLLLLTIGMSVDCQRTYFERIKEELARKGKGRSARQIADGFWKCTFSILDLPNITTGFKLRLLLFIFVQDQ